MLVDRNVVIAQLKEASALIGGAIAHLEVAGSEGGLPPASPYVGAGSVDLAEAAAASNIFVASQSLQTVLAVLGEASPNAY